MRGPHEDAEAPLAAQRRAPDDLVEAQIEARVAALEAGPADPVEVAEHRPFAAVAEYADPVVAGKSALGRELDLELRLQVAVQAVCVVEEGVEAGVGPGVVAGFALTEGMPSLRPSIGELRVAQTPSPARVAVAVGILAILTVLGALGYRLIEDLSWLDAMYMAVITLSTVGYSEVHELSPGGRGFTIVFIVVGLGATFYAVVSLAEFFIAGRLTDLLGRRSMRRSIRALEDHVIVCGFGRLGRAVAEQLEQSGVPIVIVDRSPDGEAEVLAGERFCVIGSALDDAVLREAGIEQAQAIVVATPSDADNVFIALSARELNPQVSIHARAETEAGKRRLKLAGASQVVGLHGIGGQRIAQAIVRPTVVDFIELSQPGAGAPIDLEEVVLGEGSAIARCRLDELPGQGLSITVVAIKRDGEETLLHPKPDTALRAGDHVVVVGDRANLQRLAALAEGRDAGG